MSDPPLIVPIEDLLPPGGQRDDVEGEMRGILRSYRRTLESDRRHLLENFDYVHMARKVVGVGSVGTRAWIMLLLGRDGQDPLFLQAKEAQGPSRAVRRQEPLRQSCAAGGCRAATDAGSQRHLPGLAAGRRL